ncbi:hypothetical protein LSAT2_021662 [Lamellibrachia satsuma]|nr:hypothetical protein LSAT2_021662 [Lamellibrachia satsuma]
MTGSWSVFGQSVRTNNDLEGWHHGFNRRGRLQMPFYQLTGLLFDEAAQIEVTLRLVSEGKVRRHQRKTFKDLQGKISLQWDLYRAGDRTVMQCLKTLSRRDHQTPGRDHWPRSPKQAEITKAEIPKGRDHYEPTTPPPPPPGGGRNILGGGGGGGGGGAVKQDLQESASEGCSCTKDTCKCCVFIKIPKILQVTVCIDVRYIPKDVGVAIDISWNGKIIISQELSARNPPPLCLGIPEFEKEGSICLELYDMEVTASTFSGCAKLVLQLFKIYDMTIPFGCFHMPVSEIEYILNETENKM